MRDLLITHIADIDGLSPIILLKLCQRDFDYKLLEIENISLYFEELFAKDLSLYENIYVTDLTLMPENYEKIEKSLYKDKFKVFDHHKTHEFACIYPYVTIDTNECGTSLFYQYLKGKYSLSKKNIEEYVDHVKNLDIWLWVKKEDFLARDLGDLLSLYGKKMYIEEMYERLQNEDIFDLSFLEKKILCLQAKKKEKYVEKKEEKMYIIKFENYKIGIVFSEQYRSEMGDILSKKYPHLDCVAMINVGGGVSFRTIKDDIALSTIAEKMGGGGHQKSAGFGFPENLRREVIQKLFEGSVIQNADE